MSEPTPKATVSEVTEVTPELIEAFNRLTPQLSSSSPPPSPTDLAEIVASPASVLLVARDGSGAIIGSLHFGQDGRPKELSWKKRIGAMVLPAT